MTSSLEVDWSSWHSDTSWVRGVQVFKKIIDKLIVILEDQSDMVVARIDLEELGHISESGLVLLRLWDEASVLISSNEHAKWNGGVV